MNTNLLDELCLSEEYAVDLARLWHVIDTVPVSPRSTWDAGRLFHLRYTADGAVQRSYAILALDYGVSPHRIRQVVRRTCRTLRHPSWRKTYAVRVNKKAGGENRGIDPQ